MNNFLTVIKGFIIGIAKIIPGVSGSVLALSLGVYERVIDIVSNIKNIKLEDIKYLFLLMIGLLIGITSFAGGVKFCLDNYYLHTILLFTGLIIGGIPNLFKEINFKLKNIPPIAISILIVVLISNLTNNSNSLKINNLLYFNMGITEAFTTIIPGISGTAIFISLGWYETLLEIFTGISLFKTKFSYIVFFIIGFITAGLFIIKIISYLLTKHKSNTYSIILGFVIGSIFIMLKTINFNTYSIINIISGIFVLIIGMYINKIIDKL